MQKLVFMLCGVLAFSLVAETVDVSAVGWREKVDVSVGALSLKRVYGGKTVPPSLPSKLKIEVAEGAKLNLDFVGTLPSGIVRLGARTYTGTIDAAGFPDFVTGTGALEAKSEGTLVIVR